MNSNKDNNIKKILEVDLDKVVEIGKEREDKQKKIIIIVLVVIILLICIYLLFKNIIIPNNNKLNALSYMKEKQYDKALELADKNEDDNLKEYILAYKYMMNGEYYAAINKYKKIKDYEESNKLKKRCQDSLNEETYKEATEYLEEGHFLPASELFDNISNYKDSNDMAFTCRKLYYINKLGANDKESISYFKKI